jgi:hypothetical protein
MDDIPDRKRVPGWAVALVMLAIAGAIGWTIYAAITR